MKTVFIKSGGYYETPGISVVGAINDTLGYRVSQFNKVEAQFRFDCVNHQYRIYPPVDRTDAEFYFKVDMELLTSKAEQYGFAYLGTVGSEDTAIRPMELLRDLAAVTVDPTSGQFINAATGEFLTGNNVTPLAYCVKMANNVYALILTKLVYATSRVVTPPKPLPAVLSKGINVIAVDDGAAIRKEFVNLRFSDNVRHVRNDPVITGYAVFARAGTTVELDIFRNSPLITEEFKNSFQIVVESSFPHTVSKDHISLTMPTAAGTGYLTVKLRATPLYEDIASREIKEVLTFDFIVCVL